MDVYDLYIFCNEMNYIVTQWLKYKYYPGKFHQFTNAVLCCVLISHTILNWITSMPTAYLQYYYTVTWNDIVYVLSLHTALSMNTTNRKDNVKIYGILTITNASTIVNVHILCADRQQCVKCIHHLCMATNKNYVFAEMPCTHADRNLHARNDGSWRCHQMETFPALLALCEGNPPVTDGFPSQRLVTQSFDVFYDVRLNKRLWFETPWRSLWRHCNVRSSRDYMSPRMPWKL